jgi:hypothetical protein
MNNLQWVNRIIRSVPKGPSRVRRSAALAVMMGIFPILRSAAAEEALGNWFNDPFFQVSNGMSHCPTPRGPMLTEAEKIAESHSRVERGTSCWLAGRCAHANAYAFDAGIGQRIQNILENHTEFSGDSIWITVSRRFVWVQGCVASNSSRTKLTSLLAHVEEADYVFFDIMIGEDGVPPYRTLKKR